MSRLMHSAFHILFKKSTQALLLLDKNHRIIDANAAFIKLSGHGLTKLLHQSFFYPSRVENKLNHLQHWKGRLAIPQTIFQKTNMPGEIFRIHDDTQPIDLIIFLNETNVHELWKKAYLDQLTRLGNAFLIRDEMQNLIRNNISFAFFYMDIDGFKAINDLWGHEIGDQLLKSVAKRLRLCQKDIHQVGRLHGDEFVMIVRNHHQSYEFFAKKVLNLFKKPISIHSHPIYLNISIGISCYPKDSQSIQELMNHADEAMMQAKHLKSLPIVFYNAQQHIRSLKKLCLIQELEKALAMHQFEIYLQPILNVHTNSIEKAEALIRWNHPTHGLMCTHEFLPMIEKNEFLVQLNDWVFHEVCKNLSHWKKKFPSLQIFINVPGILFSYPKKSFEYWFKISQQYGLTEKDLILEITEESLFQPQEMIIKKLKDLQKKGLQIALDDFGTGFVSMAYLKKISVQLIKINHIFTHDIHCDEINQKICKSIIELAHQLNIKIIAEDVEKSDDRQMLEQLGVDFIQGYLVQKPMNIVSFEKLLANKLD